MPVLQWVVFITQERDGLRRLAIQSFANLASSSSVTIQRIPHDASGDCV